MKRSFIALVLFLFPFLLNAQFAVKGIVVDSLGSPLVGAAVYSPTLKVGTATANNGEFKLVLSQIVDSVEFNVSCVGYEPKLVWISHNKKYYDGSFRITLSLETHRIDEVYVKANQRRIGNIEKLNVADIDFLPNASGNFESLLKSMPGVSSSNELSSQYSVRGGNFDENLIYVNGIEIYRPFLVRSGQQEGLSFINPDMVQGVEFSAGAFNAEYGDKMSSVLDVHYRKPDSFRTNAAVSLLGANLATEGVTRSGRFSYMMGLRYKTSKYMLNSLDSKGDYTPTFIDWQGLFNFQITDNLQCSILGNYSSNSYLFAPEVRETRFGSFNNTLQLKIFYEGQEVDKFQSGMGAVSLAYTPAPGTKLTVYSANYLTNESETFDLFGQYYLNELDNQLGSTTYTDSLLNVGIGGFLNHARNYLTARIHSVGMQGSHSFGDNTLKIGADYRQEYIDDEISEWDYIDSSGYSLPYNGSSIALNNVLKAKNCINVSRLSAFVQDNVSFELGGVDMSAVVGFRFLWWSYSREFLFSPRASLTFIPKNNRNIQLHVSSGVYYQSPFYKELRFPSGSLNPSIKSQKSTQLLMGANYYFSAWERPFRLSLEAYYKWLDNLIPYEVDNVRVRYAGDNIAVGYAKGVDLKLNGEMVEDAESWVGISLMKTEEDIINDKYVVDGVEVYPGYYRRPTDQRFTFSLFFQDYLPGYDLFKVHLSGFYGSGLPYNVQNSSRYDMQFSMPAYRRVDIGFTLNVYDRQPQKSLIKQVVPGFSSINMGVEIFNLFNFNNTVSYLWVKTVGNQNNESGQYAVPNYLTSFRVNLKLSASF